MTDVWNSREEFDKFAQDQIGSFTAEVGIPSPPKMSFYEVHNYRRAPERSACSPVTWGLVAT